MHVCIIGAGVSGLDAARHLLDKENGKNNTCEIFERNEDIGGSWFYTDDVGTDKYGYPVYACMYSGLRTNLPKQVMGYANYKWPDQGKSYISQEEVITFIRKFADDFKLRPLIKLSTMVKEIRPLPGNRWSVTTVDLPKKAETTKEFDAVIVSSGHFNVGSYPNIPGQKSFQGNQIHSHDYRKPEPYKNKKLLLIGAGPSGLDLAVILSDHATTVVLSHRNDIVFDTKFPGNVTLKPEVTRVTETRAEFSDGTTETFDSIIYCTGYKYYFPFFHKDCKIVIQDYISPLYKHLINIEFPTMCITGIPSRACSFPLYDLQIRYYVQYLNGKMTLPTKQEMLDDTAKDIQKRKDLGLPPKKYHLMSADFVWDYYKSLADAANIENVWKSIVQLRLDSAKQIGKNLLTFRKDNYQIIDKDTYVKLND